jgi:hypothetical protein
MPDEFSVTDIKQLRPMSRAEVETKLSQNPEQFAPTFRLIWQKYKDKIPV